MIFLFPRWDMLVPWRVLSLKEANRYLLNTARNVRLRSGEVKGIRAENLLEARQNSGKRIEQSTKGPWLFRVYKELYDPVI